MESLPRSCFEVIVMAGRSSEPYALMTTINGSPAFRQIDSDCLCEIISSTRAHRSESTLISVSKKIGELIIPLFELTLPINQSSVFIYYCPEKNTITCQPDLSKASEDPILAITSAPVPSPAETFESTPASYVSSPRTSPISPLSKDGARGIKAKFTVINGHEILRKFLKEKWS